MTFTINREQFEEALSAVKTLIQVLKNINQTQSKIHMTNEELLAAIQEVGGNLDEALTELSQAIQNQGQVSPEVASKMEGVLTVSRSLKDLVPGSPTPPPTPA